MLRERRQVVAAASTGYVPLRWSEVQILSSPFCAMVEMVSPPNISAITCATNPAEANMERTARAENGHWMAISKMA